MKVQLKRAYFRAAWTLLVYCGCLQAGPMHRRWTNLSTPLLIPRQTGLSCILSMLIPERRPG